MDYFNEFPTTFLNRGNISVTLLSMGGVGFHHNILICVLQMNEGLLDLEWIFFLGELQFYVLAYL